MYIPEFICGMAAMILIEIVLVFIAVAIHSAGEDKEQCKDAVSEKESHS